MSEPALPRTAEENVPTAAAAVVSSSAGARAHPRSLAMIALEAVREYHATVHASLQAYLTADAKAYLRPPSENPDAFFHAVSGYFGDVVLWEPALLRMYDEMLPQIRRELGDE